MAAMVSAKSTDAAAIRVGVAQGVRLEPAILDVSSMASATMARVSVTKVGMVDTAVCLVVVLEVTVTNVVGVKRVQRRSIQKSTGKDLHI